MKRKKMRCKALDALGPEKTREAGWMGNGHGASFLYHPGAARDGGAGRGCGHSNRRSEKQLRQYHQSSGEEESLPCSRKGVLKVTRR